MRGQVIGKSMPHGYAGSYARQADMVVDTHPSEGEIAFGAPVVLGTAGAVKPWEAASTAAKFVGVALRERSTSALWKMSLTRRQLSEALKRQQIPERTWN